jgi:hypothetical protein
MGLVTAISLGLAVVGTGLSVTQAIKGSQAKSEADAAAENSANQIARISEANKFASLKVPTMGLDLATQRMREWQQTQIQALKEGGATTVLGGMPGVSQQAYAQERELAAQADTMQYNRDLALAQNAQQIEGNRVGREASLAGARLSGAQNASIAGQNQMDAGIQGAIGNLSNAAFAYQYFNQNKPVGNTTTPPAKINSDSYNPTGAVPMPLGQTPASAWQSNFNQQPSFKGTISQMPQNNMPAIPLNNYPGLTDIQSGDPLNDMYNRNARNQMYGNLYKYGNPRF